MQDFYTRLEAKITNSKESTSEIADKLIELQGLSYKAKYQQDYNKLLTEFYEEKQRIEERIIQAEEIYEELRRDLEQKSRTSPSIKNLKRRFSIAKKNALLNASESLKRIEEQVAEKIVIMDKLVAISENKGNSVSEFVYECPTHQCYDIEGSLRYSKLKNLNEEFKNLFESKRNSYNLEDIKRQAISKNGFTLIAKEINALIKVGK